MSKIENFDSLRIDLKPPSKSKSQTHEKLGKNFNEELLKTVATLEKMDSEIENVIQNTPQDSHSVTSNVKAVGKLLHNMEGMIESISGQKSSSSTSQKAVVAKYSEMAKKSE